MKPLEQQLNAALRKVDEIKARRSNLNDTLTHQRVDPIMKMISEERRKINEELNAQFNEPYANAVNEASRLKEAVNQERIKKSNSNPLIGRTVQQWSRRYSGSPLHKTDKIAAIEVYDGNNVAFKSSWGRPAIGSVILRNIKKDGTLGKTFLGVLHDGKLPPNWHPLGVDPNDEASNG